MLVRSIAAKPDFVFLQVLGKIVLALDLGFKMFAVDHGMTIFAKRKTDQLWDPWQTPNCFTQLIGED